MISVGAAQRTGVVANEIFVTVGCGAGKRIRVADAHAAAVVASCGLVGVGSTGLTPVGGGGGAWCAHARIA